MPRLPLASLLLLLLLGCDQGQDPGDQPAPLAPVPRLDRPLPLARGGSTAAPLVEGPASPLGLPPPAANEPARAPDRSSPSRLIQELEGALARRDLPALARLRHGPAMRPALDREDLTRAERDFFQDGGPAFWGRILGAIEPAALEELDRAASAAEQRGLASEPLQVPVDLGGSVGSVVLILRREPDGWVLR